MTNDYDIVIIGGSVTGRYAALLAAQLKAKVALVEPKINYGFIYRQSFREFAINLPFSVNTSPKLNWEEAIVYANNIATNQQQQYSPAILAANGVDIIVGDGQFQTHPRLVFAVNQRLLKSRTYLLITGSVVSIPEIEGLEKAGFLTPADIWQSLNQLKSSKNWVILGATPQSLELAQIISRLGGKVTIIINHSYIFPGIEPEIAQLLQAQLEVEGVRFLTQTVVSQVRVIEQKKWLQAGDKAIQTDEIIVTTLQPNIKSLNLAAAGVKWNQHRILVNDKLQTTCNIIYACGDVIGGYDLINIANYEARIAIKNALFLPRLKVNYHPIPWAIFTDPALGQVGLTEYQAKRQYNSEEIIVLQQYFKILSSAQLQDKTTGVCKIIVLSDGEILGASIFGAESVELINLLALAIARKIKIQHLEDISPLIPSFSEIIEQTVLSWNQQKLNNNINLQEFLESFFYFRRNWNL